MVARFILSLDCEGKWGVADCLTRSEHTWLSDERLRQAYRGITELLDEYEVPATFAFVGLFAASEQTFRQLSPVITRLAHQAPNYLGPALFDSLEGSRQGWHGDWAVHAVSNARIRHEIGLHGVTHVPWTTQGPNFFAEELALLRELRSPVSESRTFVFPRNEVAHLELLESAGLQGYRMAPRPTSRARNLLSAFNLWSAPEHDSQGPRSGIIPIPGGYFINWRHGLRRLVPPWLTRARFRLLLDNAGSEGVVHAWMHPENVASAPDTLDLLRDIVSLVARKRDLGHCEVLTQINYVESLRSAAQ